MFQRRIWFCLVVIRALHSIVPVGPACGKGLGFPNAWQKALFYTWLVLKNNDWHVPSIRYSTVCTQKIISKMSTLVWVIKLGIFPLFFAKTRDLITHIWLDERDSKEKNPWNNADSVWGAGVSRSQREEDPRNISSERRLQSTRRPHRSIVCLMLDHTHPWKDMCREMAHSRARHRTEWYAYFSSVVTSDMGDTGTSYDRPLIIRLKGRAILSGNRREILNWVTVISIEQYRVMYRGI